VLRLHCPARLAQRALIEPPPHSAHAHDQLGMLGVSLEAVAEAVHVHVHCAWIDSGLWPDVRENLRAVQDAVGQLHEKSQQLELPTRQVHRATIHPHLVGVEIDPQVAPLVDGAGEVLADPPHPANGRPFVDSSSEKHLARQDAAAPRVYITERLREGYDSMTALPACHSDSAGALDSQLSAARCWDRSIAVVGAPDFFPIGVNLTCQPDVRESSGHSAQEIAMVGNRFTVGWPDNYVAAAISAFVASRLFASDGWAPSDLGDPAVGWHGIEHAVVPCEPGPAGPEEFEVTATLRVRGEDLEEVVARTFADPHCVDVRVQSTRWDIPE